MTIWPNDHAALDRMFIKDIYYMHVYCPGSGVDKPVDLSFYINAKPLVICCKFFP